MSVRSISCRTTSRFRRSGVCCVAFISSVLDVAVDIRPGSPTFGQNVTVVLSGENKRQFFIPRGFAHGFLVLEDNTVFQYKCDNYYAPESEGSYRWNDPYFNIDWGISPDEVILSPKDAVAPFFEE